nr:hypothetical protein CFP56_52847 [Quercus suber]
MSCSLWEVLREILYYDRVANHKSSPSKVRKDNHLLLGHLFDMSENQMNRRLNDRPRARVTGEVLARSASDQTQLSNRTVDEIPG